MSYILNILKIVKGHPMYSKLRLFCICLLFFQSFSGNTAVTIKSPEHELNVLIDVSGSMKQNDPDNLRIPAVKLLINLLPEGTKAGIWLFAQHTKVLIKAGVVNKHWKKSALSRINKIHSRGLFTNIEDAIQTSSQGWFQSSGEQKRNLILLTDGVVDVSKDIMQSAESRERVLVEQIPLLQQSGVKVYTIALSENADTELMDKLAFDTDGWSETANSAEQLQKVFFKMFKQAVPQDTVPLVGNTFTVDAGIKEFSVLVFKKRGAQATQLIMPDNSKIGSANHRNNVAWLDEKTYDLVTIKKPKTGKWKIDATMDPDNQVMIVTDLKFQVDEIPHHLSENESLEILAYFTDQQQLISREDFLNLIDVSVERTDEQGGKVDAKMQAVSGKQGLFKLVLKSGLEVGKHTIKIVADGKTFQRENSQTVEVAQSPIMLETDVNLAERIVKLKLIPDITAINAEMMTIQAMISQTNKETETRIIEKKQGKWELELAAPAPGYSKIINFSIIAKTLQGNSISPSIRPVIINDALFSKTELIKPNSIVEDMIKAPETDKNKEEEEITEEVEEQEGGVNWMKTAAIVVGINIVLIVAGFFAYKFLKKRSAEKQAQLLDRLS